MDRRRFYMLMALLMLSGSVVVGQNAAADEQAEQAKPTLTAPVFFQKNERVSHATPTTDYIQLRKGVFL
jgi:hypothetical protein